MYLHVQTAGGAHRVGYNNMKCQHERRARLGTGPPGPAWEVRFRDVVNISGTCDG